MSNMKAKLEEILYHAQEAKECYPDEELEVNWLESSDEWVVNRGEYIIEDGLTECEANNILNLLEGHFESEISEN